mmetsp:Transcript_13451/g.25323  ORF Transcript_13451/g.25323 Transcript_13451/m.25323 type:complete len:324 (+) Transcript_13451:84-1055(+)
MDNLQELTSLEVTVIVDNECDTMSSAVQVDGFQYRSEKSQHSAAESMCVGAHGLSLLLTATTSNMETHTIMLDAGPTPQIWEQNATKLNVDLETIEAVVLSHYHYDHSGGLRGAIPRIMQHSKSLVVDLESSTIVSRGEMSLESKQVRKHEPDSPTVSELSAYGANVLLHDTEHTLCNDCFYVSGYIPRKTLYEKGLPGHVTLVSGKWQSDTDIRDERYVACKIKDRGLVVFSACSHAGINNVCLDAIEKSSKTLFGVVGGLHLAGGRVENRVDATVTGLEEMNPAVVLAGHCTGWRGKAALAEVFPNRFQPLAVGGKYIFQA